MLNSLYVTDIFQNTIKRESFFLKSLDHRENKSFRICYSIVFTLILGLKSPASVYSRWTNEQKSNHNIVSESSLPACDSLPVTCADSCVTSIPLGSMCPPNMVRTPKSPVHVFWSQRVMRPPGLENVRGWDEWKTRDPAVWEPRDESLPTAPTRMVAFLPPRVAQSQSAPGGLPGPKPVALKPSLVTALICLEQQGVHFFRHPCSNSSATREAEHLLAAP